MAAAKTGAKAPQNVKKYGSWSADDAREELGESQSSGGGADFLKLKTGKNVLRFLPPREGEKSPFVVVHQHYIEVPGGQKAASFTCPRMHKQGACPACARAQELRDTGNPADYERAGKLLPRRRVFANVIDRSDPERGPVILPMGKTIHEQLLALRDNEEAGGDFTDPTETGFDITIEKSGEGLKTEYKVFPARNNKALGNDEWLDQMHDLNRLSRVEDLAAIKAKMGDDGGSAAPARVSASRGGTSGGGRRGAAPARTAEDDQEDTE